MTGRRRPRYDDPDEFPDFDDEPGMRWWLIADHTPDVLTVDLPDQPPELYGPDGRPVTPAHPVGFAVPTREPPIARD